MSDYYKFPPGDYRETYKKGRIYHAPFPFQRKQPIIVRPLHDNLDSDGKIPGDLYLTENKNGRPNNTFRHQGFKVLNLKSDEEYYVTKVKKRPVVLLKNPSEDDEKVKVVPLRTIKNKDRKFMDIKNLKENQDSIDFIYLPHDQNFSMKESLILLTEMRSLYLKDLEPKRLELKQSIIEMLDQKIAMDLDMFDYEENSSQTPE